MRKIHRLIEESTPSYYAKTLAFVPVFALNECKLSPFGTKKRGKRWHRFANKILRDMAGTNAYIVIHRAAMEKKVEDQRGWKFDDVVARLTDAEYDEVCALTDIATDMGYNHERDLVESVNYFKKAKSIVAAEAASEKSESNTEVKTVKSKVKKVRAPKVADEDEDDLDDELGETSASMVVNPKEENVVLFSGATSN